ncbi:hypothetical protein FRB99_007273 [Tulasnella sp. 403]|nr:hypothetical protein FRB99_007273 [Tulasnella sp. 403]
MLAAQKTVPHPKMPSPSSVVDSQSPRPSNDKYSRTPSLTSSTTSIDSIEPQPTPPSTANGSKPLSLSLERSKPVPLDGLVRNPALSIDDSSPEGILSSSPPRARPPRPPMPDTYVSNPDWPHPQDGLSIISVSSYKRPARRGASTGYLLDGHQSWLVALCFRPKILTSLLQFLDFADFHAVTCTSKAIRDILDEQQARDTILSRFVPGYRLGSPSVKDIRVDLRDLEALMLSQAIPLQIYPQHALDIIAGLPATEATGSLQRFTSVHSRFVLLLRQRAPQMSYLSELDDPQWRFGGFTEQPNLRELTFPAPLSYPHVASPIIKEKPLSSSPEPELTAPRPAPPAVTPPRRKIGCRRVFRALFGSPPPRPSPPQVTPSRQRNYPAYAAHTVPRDGSSPSLVSSLARRSSRLLPPPPPERTPTALKQYRRRSRIMSVSLTTPSRSATLNTLKEQKENDDELFTPPRPPHLRTSSLPSSSSTSASEPSLPRRRTLRTPSPKPSLNPHDLECAASRARAPVYRVFVPCDNFGPSVLLACEGEMVSAGIWSHLKSGDVVCNLGYVPPAGSNSDDSTVGWLIFNGQSLTPYFPPNPPALNAFRLHSPMYYSHLLPPFTNPRFYLNIPPSASPEKKRKEPDLMLIPLKSSVRSPATRSGYVRVRSHAWIGKVDSTEILAAYRSRLAPGGEDAMSDFFGFNGGLIGEGWNAEWVVEAEGTREGKAGLLLALDPPEEGAEDSEWEIVRDKCLPGRLWMRLIVHPPPTESTDDFGRYQDTTTQ